MAVEDVWSPPNHTPKILYFLVLLAHLILCVRSLNTHAPVNQQFPQNYWRKMRPQQANLRVIPQR